MARSGHNESTRWPVRWQVPPIHINAIEEGAVWEPASPLSLLWELLDAGDVITAETHKNRLGRWLSVNPVLDIISVGIPLADFVIGLADRGNHFFPIHAHGRPAVLDGLFHFRRQCVVPLHRGR